MRREKEGEEEKKRVSNHEEMMAAAAAAAAGATGEPSGRVHPITGEGPPEPGGAYWGKLGLHPITGEGPPDPVGTFSWDAAGWLLRGAVSRELRGPYGKGKGEGKNKGDNEGTDKGKGKGKGKYQWIYTDPSVLDWARFLHGSGPLPAWDSEEEAAEEEAAEEAGGQQRYGPGF